MSTNRRSESLIPLSREHHYALMLCLRIRQGSEERSGPEWLLKKAEAVAVFFTESLRAHFGVEEEILFPAMSGMTGASGIIADLLNEHRDLAARAIQLSQPAGLPLQDLLIRFADLLEAHVRKEERLLFPLFQLEASTELESTIAMEISGRIGSAIEPRNPKLLE